MIKDVLKKNKIMRRIIETIGVKRKIRCVQKFGIKAIETVTEALNREGICSFADFGTLLGLMREKHLLNHDADVDIGIVVDGEDTIKKADFILEALGYKLIREFTIQNGIKEQSYIKQHVKIDLQIYTIEDATGLMSCYLFYNPKKELKEVHWKSVIKKCPKVDSIKTILIDDCKIPIPGNAEEILIYKYGENWKVPDKSWVYWEGPNTYPIEESGLLKSIENGGIK